MKLLLFVFALAAAQVAPRVRAPSVERVEGLMAASEESFTITAVGDTMLGSDFPTNRLMSTPSNYFKDAGEVIRKGDVAFVNVEGCLMDGGRARKSCSSNCYLFRSPTSYGQTLKDAGFNLATLANNHARDFVDGMELSKGVLEEAGFWVSGPDTVKFTVKGRKFALVSFGFNAGMNDVRDIPEAVRLVESAAADGSIVLVSAHMGAEGANALHITKRPEIGFGEQRGNPYAFAHAVIDAGADIVLGHGPHVPRAVQIYQDRLIAYSMGNFATWYGMSVSGQKGYSMVLEAELAGDGSFKSGKIHSFKQSRDPNRPLRLDSAHSTARLVAELTREDFGAGAGVSVRPDGTLVPGPGGASNQYGCSEWKCETDKSVIKAAQRICGTGDDGIWGSGSQRALDKKLEELGKPMQGCLSACAVKWLSLE